MLRLSFITVNVKLKVLLMFHMSCFDFKCMANPSKHKTLAKLKWQVGWYLEISFHLGDYYEVDGCTYDF